MVSTLSFERPERASEQEAGVAALLLGLADRYGLYSGLYLHFGHARGGPARAIASSAIARRQYVDLIAASSIAVRALNAHRPFAWTSREAQFARAPDSDHSGIAIPVQDHVNGPGLVALIGIGIDAAAAVVRDEGPALSWSATELHLSALAAIRAERSVAPTSREMECLRMAAEGMTVAAIGRALGIAGRTVEFHLRNVVEKLGATSKVNAVAIAASRGLLHCDPAGAPAEYRA